MDDIAADDYVIVLDHSDIAVLIIAHWSLTLAAPTMVLLGRDNVTSEHLRILNLNLRIVKNVIVVVYVFDDLDRLLMLLALLLWL